MLKYYINKVKVTTVPIWDQQKFRVGTSEDSVNFKNSQGEKTRHTPSNTND